MVVVVVVGVVGELGELGKLGADDKLRNTCASGASGGAVGAGVGAGVGAATARTIEFRMLDVVGGAVGAVGAGVDKDRKTVLSGADGGVGAEGGAIVGATDRRIVLRVGAGDGAGASATGFGAIVGTVRRSDSVLTVGAVVGAAGFGAVGAGNFISPIGLRSRTITS